MSSRMEAVREFSEAIAGRRWNSCPSLLYRVFYGMPASVLLPFTAGQITRTLAPIEKRWPGVAWPRRIVEDTQQWIAESGRSIPDSPERNSDLEVAFVFSLDALLLAFSYPENTSVLTSSCACAIRETVTLGVQLRAEAGGFEEDIYDECEGCGAAARQKPAPSPESPIEFARSREWQTILDAVMSANLQNYPDVESTDHMEADLATWDEHAQLLIVPEAARLLNAK